MGLTSRTIVESGWLAKHLNDENVIITDCRYNLMDSGEGRRKYLAGHIPGAYFVDMESDLTGDKQEHGGRHPIPDLDEFERKMSSIGIEKGKTVVAYDDDLSGASRLWWLLNYFGHSDVYVLNGGVGKWIEEGRGISIELPKLRNSRFKSSVNHNLLYDVHSLRLNRESQVVIDSRAPERYAGKHEPIDFKAGHIPGAVNIFYKDTMEPDGKMRDKDELRRIYRSVGSNPVIYCGSGITSCVNVLGLAVIGIEARLYSGSWSDWISYPENEIETEEK